MLVVEMGESLIAAEPLPQISMSNNRGKGFSVCIFSSLYVPARRRQSLYER
jgi:hypothetical protein